jgi:E1-E2 ATPase
MALVQEKDVPADLDQITESGVHPPESTQDLDDHEHGFEIADVLRVFFVVLAAAAVWFRVWEPFHKISVIGLAATLIGGWPIFREAFENILERRMTMELSMTIALVSALAIGEFFTALVITAFVLAAEILEGLTVGRGRKAIQDMLDFLPQKASVLRNGQVVEVDTQTIVPGEIVLIRPGAKIPVDGEVTSGQSFVEQAAITGEPMPSEKTLGSHVYAGTINQAGTLQVRAERLGRDTTFGKIIEAVERAEHSRAPIQKTADRLAGYLVYFALGAAVLTFLITHNARSTISVIIVAGACGIAAGTPLAILGAIGTQRWPTPPSAACGIFARDRRRGEAGAARPGARPPLWLGHVGLGEVASRNWTEKCLLLPVSTAAAVPSCLSLRGLGGEPLCRALVRFRPSGPGALALDHGRSESCRRDVELLGQLRQVGQSERPGPSPMACVHQRGEQSSISGRSDHRGWLAQKSCTNG